MKIPPGVTIRAARPADEPFIYSTWIKHYGASVVAKLVRPKARYAREQHDLVERLLSEAAVLVAADVEDDGHIFGWACGEKGTLHYAYVKAGARREGLGRLLIARVVGSEDRRARFLFSHMPPGVERLMRKYPGAVYSPYLRRSDGEDRRVDGREANPAGDGNRPPARAVLVGGE